MIHFFRPISSVDVRKVKARDDAREHGVRLYCEQFGASWCLQVRATLKTARGVEGEDFVVAGASLSKEDLLALRAAIDAQLAEAEA